MRVLQIVVASVFLAPWCPRASCAGEPAGAAQAPARGYAGFHVEPVAILSEVQRAAVGVAGDRGSVVALVLPDGPAAAAGLKVGDLLVSWDGRPVPEVTTEDRYEAQHHAWRVAMRGAMDALVAGRTFALDVRRGEGTLTLRVTPVGEAEIHRLMGGTLDPLPDPTRAGAPVSWTADFDGLPAGAKVPEGFRPYEGRWLVTEEPGGAKKNFVLRQDIPVLPWAVLLVTGPGHACADGSARVRFSPVSGVVDASAGIVFRAKDAKNYYLVRANALEDNFNLYVVKDGVRTALKESRVKPPSLGSWHVLDLSFVGDSLRATLDGKDQVEARDSTFATGWCGLWTKADSVTLFDDFVVSPVVK